VYADLGRAMNLDGLRNSHPVEVLRSVHDVSDSVTDPASAGPHP
jgi:hypothetical protein